VGHTLTGSTLPAVAVDRPTGDALAVLAGEEAVLDIEATVLNDHESANVLGRVPGHSSDRPVFVTAHYDSWDNAEGAIDNALGVGMMMMLAERLAAGPTPDHTVVFLATAGEEQGLTGAFRFVSEVPEAANARFVLNLDIPWAQEGRYIVSTTDPSLQRLALQTATDLGLDPVDGGAPSPASDHLPFQMQGVPAAWHTRYPDRHYHTHEDTLEKLALEESIPALELNWTVLRAVAFSAHAP
jgi:Zn-dependent M28 family amino/carboxypeptidase